MTLKILLWQIMKSIALYLMVRHSPAHKSNRHQWKCFNVAVVQRRVGEYTSADILLEVNESYSVNMSMKSNESYSTAAADISMEVNESYSTSRPIETDESSISMKDNESYGTLIVGVKSVP